MLFERGETMTRSFKITTNWKQYLKVLAISLLLIVFLGCDKAKRKTTTSTPETPKKPVEPEPPKQPYHVINKLTTPVRITQAENGRYYVTDSTTDSVFVLGPDLKVIGELKGMGKPLGVAVTSYGWIYVGSDERDGIDVYGRDGKRVRTLDSGNVKKPNDMAFDTVGNLYVVDSLANVVYVYSPSGDRTATIGADSGLNFPCAIAVNDSFSSDPASSGLEVYVADQGNKRIIVFDGYGNTLRILDGKTLGFLFAPGMDMMGGFGSSPFMRIQAIDVDYLGNLHVLDCYLHQVKVIEQVSDSVIDSYGSYGDGPGELLLPLDLLLVDGKAMITNAKLGRIDVLNTGQ